MLTPSLSVAAAALLHIVVATSRESCEVRDSSNSACFTPEAVDKPAQALHREHLLFQKKARVYDKRGTLEALSLTGDAAGEANHQAGGKGRGGKVSRKAAAELGLADCVSALDAISDSDLKAGLQEFPIETRQKLSQALKRVRESAAAESKTEALEELDEDACFYGEFSTDGTEPCQLCPAGKFGDHMGAVACADCETGKYTDYEGATECWPFAMGNVEQAEEGACHPGMFSASGKEPCNLCAPGKFAVAAGTTACSDCVVGTYVPDEGASECAQCPDGMTSNTDASACIQGVPITDLTNVIVDAEKWPEEATMDDLGDDAYVGLDTRQFLGRPEWQTTSRCSDFSAASCEPCIGPEDCWSEIPESEGKGRILNAQSSSWSRFINTMHLSVSTGQLLFYIGVHSMKAGELRLYFDGVELSQGIPIDSIGTCVYPASTAEGVEKCIFARQVDSPHGHVAVLEWLPSALSSSVQLSTQGLYIMNSFIGKMETRCFDIFNDGGEEGRMLRMSNVAKRACLNAEAPQALCATWRECLAQHGIDEDMYAIVDSFATPAEASTNSRPKASKPVHSEHCIYPTNTDAEAWSCDECYEHLANRCKEFSTKYEDYNKATCLVAHYCLHSRVCDSWKRIACKGVQVKNFMKETAVDLKRCAVGYTSTEMDLTDEDGESHRRITSTGSCAAICNSDPGCRGYEYNLIKSACQTKNSYQENYRKRSIGSPWISCIPSTNSTMLETSGHRIVQQDRPVFSTRHDQDAEMHHQTQLRQKAFASSLVSRGSGVQGELDRTMMAKACD